MTPRETVRPEDAPLIRRWYGVRDSEGNINGKMNGRWMFSDALKSAIALFMGIIILGGYGAWVWYQKNKDLPDKFNKHCEQQIKTDQDLAKILGRIEQYMEDSKRNRR